MAVCNLLENHFTFGVTNPVREQHCFIECVDYMLIKPFIRNEVVPPTRLYRLMTERPRPAIKEAPLCIIPYVHVVDSCYFASLVSFMHGVVGYRTSGVDPHEPNGLYCVLRLFLYLE